MNNSRKYLDRVLEKVMQDAQRVADLRGKRHDISVMPEVVLALYTDSRTGKNLLPDYTS